MSTMVTIAIPCRDAERWLADAVRSALDQGRSGRIEVDVVVVDDGSRDGSRECLAEFGGLVRLMESGGGGANMARNMALGVARGEWVQFLDADDYLLPGKIERQLEEAGNAANEAAVLYGPTYAEKWRDGKVEERTVMGIDAGTSLVEQWISWQMPQTGGALWRRSALEALGGWDEAAPCCQEHELYLRAIQAGVKMVLTPTPGAVYRLWSEQTLCRRDPRRTIAVRSQLIERMLEWVESGNGDAAAARRVAGRVFFEMSRTLAGINLGEAVAYHVGYRRRGLICVEGAAAPATYRLAYRLFGFRVSEWLAAATRKARL